MNLYRLELKRVCKTRMTAILLAIALVLAVVMAYLPVTFIGWTELDLSLIHISEPTRRTPISYAVFCLKKKKKASRAGTRWRLYT